ASWQCLLRGQRGHPMVATWVPLPILVSASRDKTLRVWDLSRDGRNVQGYPCAGSGKGEKPILGGKVVRGDLWGHYLRQKGDSHVTGSRV
uniref:Uncharacterized protein n=1 Tax=Junco hyemalis TaxID=40217 RepID=A0A8C5IR99_JUNHY